MTTGLDDFKSILKEFRSLATWGGASTASIPFLAAFAGILPSWPNHIEYITAVFQLAGMMFIYQKYLGASRTTVTNAMRCLLLITASLFVIYIFIFSLFTIQIAPNKYITIGFQCTNKAIQTYEDLCPSLGINELKRAGYDEYALWTRLSVTVIRTTIVLIWSALFISLTALVAHFLVFQTKRRIENSDT